MFYWYLFNYLKIRKYINAFPLDVSISWASLYTYKYTCIKMAKSSIWSIADGKKNGRANARVKIFQIPINQPPVPIPLPNYQLPHPSTTHSTTKSLELLQILVKICRFPDFSFGSRVPWVVAHSGERPNLFGLIYDACLATRSGTPCRKYGPLSPHKNKWQKMWKLKWKEF